MMNSLMIQYWSKVATHSSLAAVKSPDRFGTSFRSQTSLPAAKMPHAPDAIVRVNPIASAPLLVTYSILLHGLCEAGELTEARIVWKRMLDRGLNADVVAYSSVIGGLCDAGKVDEGLSLMNEMIFKGCQPDTYIYNILLNGLCKHQETQDWWKDEEETNYYIYRGLDRSLEEKKFTLVQ